MIAWINRLSLDFVIGPLATQFAMLMYDDGTNPTGNTPLLNSARDGVAFRNHMSSLAYPASTATSFNVVGALNFVTNTVLNANFGWRNRTTIVLIIGSSAK